MGAAEHRIGRVVFEIASPDPAAFDRFGELVRARFDAVVVPALQAALDRISCPGEMIRLGRVEVDLGSLDLEAPDADDLARRIADGLGAALRGAPPLGPRGAARAPDDAAELSAFLESGELPWSEPGRALATLAAALLALDAPAMAALATRLRTVLIRRRAAERLVRQLPAALVRRLYRALLPEALADPLAAAFGPDAAAAVFSSAPVPDRLVPTLVESIQRLARYSDASDFGHVLALFTALASPAAPAGPEPLEPVVEAPEPSGGAAPTAPEAAAEPDEIVQPASRPIHAAGAVLLHPFLGAFFDRLGLLASPDRFRDPVARARAVLLAHHLATGAEEAPEPETTLFKLLCGMELSDPIPRRIDLTDAERVEVDALFDSVIAHWRRLGSTSPAGLREGFLSRPGRLVRDGALWRLTVEPRGIDVLLDDLPWALSRLKTPFMRDFLVVDWR